MISPVHKWVAEKTKLKENLNQSTLKDWQQKMLNEQLRYVKENSRYYNKILPDSTNLLDLPFTTINDIANNPYDFLTIPQNKVERITTLSIPSLSESKKRVFFSKKDIEKTIDFFSIGMSVMVQSGQKAQILISSNSPNSLGSLLKESLLRIGVNSEISSSISSVKQVIEDSKDKDCLIGMPSEIYYLSKKDNSLRPKSVLLTADYVPDSIIESIKNSWNSDVFTHYGHTELGFGYAVDCQFHKGLHTRDADFIVEIISPKTGKPVVLNESGEIVITSLANEAMPLIRYKTGEISSFDDEYCECGSNLLRLKKIEGRYDNIINLPEGGVLSIHKLDEILFAEKLLLGFNARLKNENILQLTIESNGEIDKNKLADKLPKELILEIRYDTIDIFKNRNKRRIIIE